MDKVIGFIRDNPMAAVVAAGEIGFWVCIAAGLGARYLLGLRRTSVVLLAMTPLIDVVVLVATMIDLAGGGLASWTHGLAAVYLGFSVVFGPSMIRWADVRFAHRFAGGPAPEKREGAERLRHEWREWGKCLLACAIAAVVLLVLVFVVGTPSQTTALWSGGSAWLPRLGWIAGIWLVTGPVWRLFSSGSREGVRR
ncbi:hypothetical protein L3Q67_23355 [Saccharothrix sp. AJ9571]|nr:hypothetical protein L3Q67_23355 [Saccharothrix sp. AJ9571]